MKDIVVYVPKKEIGNKGMEYIDAQKRKLQLYYRVSNFPKDTEPGDWCYFAWNGHVHGRHLIIGVKHLKEGFTCETTGREWPAGKYIIREGDTLEYMREKIEIDHFRGFKYYEAPDD